MARLDLAVLGSTGLRETGGYIYEEFNRKLQGRNGVKIYEEMASNNAVIGSLIFITDMIVRQAEWRIETPDGMEEDPRAIAEKEFIETCMGDMSHTWEDFISETLSMLVFGWAYFETVYKIRKGPSNNPKTNSNYDDGRIGWRKLEIRSQDSLWRWLFDAEGGFEGMLQLDTFRGQKGPTPIPIEKALLFRTRSSKGNPEGRSLLRPAVKPWWYQKRLEEVEAIGIERDLTGMPLMEVPRELLLEDATDEDKALRAVLERMIQQIRVDERWGGLIPAELDKEGNPTGFKLRLMTSGGRRMMPTNDVIKRHESRIAMTWLAEFIFIGQDKVGTQGADESKKNLFKVALQTILKDMIASTFNRFGIGRLMELNRVPREFWPRAVPSKLESPELDKMGAFVKEMAAAGLLSPNRALEVELLDKASLPAPPEEELELFTDPTRPTPRESDDASTGVLSQGQIDAVMSINRAIKKREISRAAAEELAASTLGMDTANVGRFLIEEPPELPPMPPPPQLVPGPQGTVNRDKDPEGASPVNDETAPPEEE